MVYRRGMALLVVVGILGVLAVLGTAFVTMSRLERQASQQRLNATKAAFLARGGIEDALARIAMGQEPAAADAVHPSFFVQDSTGGPALLEVGGRQAGYSGRITEGQAYTLRITGGGISINGGDPTAPAGTGYNAVLRRMLGILAEAIDRADGVADGKPVAAADGWRIVDARPLSGWTSLQELQDMAFPGSPSTLDAFRDYLTLHAWVDRRVIAPNVHAGMAGKEYHSWGEIKLDHLSTAAGSRAPTFEPRAPVELPWARTRRPALIALLSGLKGLYLDESTCTNALALSAPAPPFDLIGTLRVAEIANTWSETDDCHVAANCILSYEGDLSTWQAWNDFCDSIPFNGTTEARQAKRDILKANFNPNSDLNKFNPNPVLFRSVDKSDLLVYSTEFSLFPVHGREVQSAGRVLSRQGRLLATQTLQVSVRGPSVLRLSTQKEFVCDDLGSLDVPGDESGVRLPGATPFLSLSQGAGKTWGHTLPALGGAGAGLQSYPEPCVDPGTGLRMNPAEYDGNLQLATVETPDSRWYGVTAATRQMTMLGRFDDGFDLGVAASTSSNGRLNHPDVQQVATVELGLSLLDGSKPNTLYPDGAYSEKERAPAYLDKGNCPPYHGLLSFWVKNGFSSPPLPSLVRGRQYVQRTNYLSDLAGAASNNQFHFLGYCGKLSLLQPAFVAHFEIGHDVLDINREHLFKTPERTDAPRRWRLLTFHWDFRSPTASDAGELLVDAGTAPKDQAPVSSYGYVSNTPDSASDVTEDDKFGPHLICLGRYGKPWESEVITFVGQGADATFDEFAVYDFGGAGPGGSPANPPGTVPTVFAGTRYEEGRYYKEADYRAPGSAPLASGEAGSWVSAPVLLPAGVRLREIRWTWLRPQELPNDYAEVELLNLDATSHLWIPSQSRSTEASGWTPDRQDWVLDQVPTGSFRIRVVFRRSTPLATDQPILESPVLDDLSLFYTLPNSGLLSWSGSP